MVVTVGSIPMRQVAVVAAAESRCTLRKILPRQDLRSTRLVALATNLVALGQSLCTTLKKTIAL